MNAFVCRVQIHECTHMRSYVTVGRNMSPLKVFFPVGDLDPSNTWFLGPTWVSIGSAAFAQLTRVPIRTDTQTTLRATSVAIGRIYELSAGDAAYKFDRRPPDGMNPPAAIWKLHWCCIIFVTSYMIFWPQQKQVDTFRNEAKHNNAGDVNSTSVSAWRILPLVQNTCSRVQLGSRHIVRFNFD